MQVLTETQKPRILLTENTFGSEEINAAIAVLKSSFVTMGSKCREFEEAFAAHLNVRHAVFVNSGSSANLLAFFALANPQLPTNTYKRLVPGSEVIVPAVTWSTTIWPIVQAGGIPVFVDTDPTTLQMDFSSVEKAINPKTVGICPVHVLGNTVPMEPIIDLAQENNLWVVEDTCEALGAKLNDKHVGTFGNIGTYSFYMSHQITTIEGGMVVTNDDDLAELMRCLRAHGWTRNLQNRGTVEALHPDIDPRFLFVNTGFNLRPTEVNAAFGLVQLKKLRHFNQKRNDIYKTWHKAFKPLFDKGYLSPIIATTSAEPAWFGYAVLCRDKPLRVALQAHLEKSGIETRPIICGNMTVQPAFRHIQHRIVGSLTGADRIMACGLYWGSHPGMSEENIDYVSKTVLEFFVS